MTVATRDQPDVTSQNPSEYVAAIDATSAVDGQIGGQFAPHEAATPNMTVLVDAGRIQVDDLIVVKTQQTSATITAPTTNPRIDRIVVDDQTGTVAIVAGTEAASPTAPLIASNQIPVAQVLLQTSTTQITNSIMTDERVIHRAPESGTWTPTLQDASLSDAEGQTYGTNNGGRYIKNGSVVFVFGTLRMATLGTLTTTDAAQISGLPFPVIASVAGDGSPGGIAPNIATNLAITAGNYITGAANENTSNISLYKWDVTTGITTLKISDVSADGNISFQGLYITS